MKKIIFFLLFVNFSFSQEIELTIHKIDSIAKTSKNKIQSSGVIKKNKKTIGGFNSTEIFSNDNPILINIYVTKTDIKTKIEERFETNLNENKIHSFKEIENPFSIKLRNKLNSLLIDYLNNKKTE